MRALSRSSSWPWWTCRLGDLYPGVFGLDQRLGLKAVSGQDANRAYTPRLLFQRRAADREEVERVAELAGTDRDADAGVGQHHRRVALRVQDRVVHRPDTVGGSEGRAPVPEVERVSGLACQRVGGLAGFEHLDARVARAVQDHVGPVGGVAQELPFWRVELVVDGLVRPAVQYLVQQPVEGCRRLSGRSGHGDPPNLPREHRLCGCRYLIWPAQEACWYSWSTPPRRFFRRMPR